MVKAGRWLRNLLGGQKDSKRGKDKSTHDPKKDKKRWSFGRSKGRIAEINTPKELTTESDRDCDEAQSKRAMAVAAATAAAAEAAVAAATAAAAVVRLTSNGHSLFNNGVGREEWAAICIQTAFRGYLARRALRALRGLVKLQALVRGHIVRKQAAITLRCMQALVRVQARVRARRVRMSEEGQAVQRQLFNRRHQDSRPRRSMDRWANWSCAELEPKFNHGLSRRGRVSTNEQPRRRQPNQNSAMVDTEPDKNHWGWTWLDRWMAARPWESPYFDELMNGMMDGDHDDVPAKIVEMDTGYSHVGAPLTSKRRNGSMSETASVEPSMVSTHRQSISKLFAPVRLGHPTVSTGPTSPTGHLSIPSPVSGGVARATLHDLSLVDYNLRTEVDSVLSTAQSSPHYTSIARAKQSGFATPHGDFYEDKFSEDLSAYPNYMASTQSAKAKVRSQSAPKQRPDPPEPIKVGMSSKKRLAVHDNGGVGHNVPSSMAIRMQRSTSQVRGVAKGSQRSAAPFRLEHASLSLRGSDTSSVDGDYHRALQ